MQPYFEYSPKSLNFRIPTSIIYYIYCTSTVAWRWKFIMSWMAPISIAIRHSALGAKAHLSTLKTVTEILTYATPSTNIHLQTIWLTWVLYIYISLSTCTWSGFDMPYTWVGIYGITLTCTWVQTMTIHCWYSLCDRYCIPRRAVIAV